MSDKPDHLTIDAVVLQEHLGDDARLMAAIADSDRALDELAPLGLLPSEVIDDVRDIAKDRVDFDNITFDDVPPPNDNGQALRLGVVEYNSSGDVVDADFSEDVRTYIFLNKQGPLLNGSENEERA
jgi:hypothetical protein